MLTERRKLRFVLDGLDPSGARAATIELRHGTIQTPIFMPVGTAGTVKTLTPDELEDAGAQIILGNTYHLYLRPGASVLAAVGGLNPFMGWQRPLLTDSGGYEFFSLSKLCRYDDDGVSFRSHLDGSAHRFTPESVVRMQEVIGSDIHMQLDECAPLPAERRVLEAAMRRSLDWARRSAVAAEQTGGALFGIVQGGTQVDLRQRHAQELRALDLAGYALGGLAVGEAAAEMYDTIEATTPHLPQDRPRYLMGVGTPTDLLEAISRGIDMFDCVMPTRNARNGQLFTSRGKLNLRNARHIGDQRPPDAACGCYTCQRFTRAYLSHLFRSQELLGHRLASIHNVSFYLALLRGARAAILDRSFGAYKARCVAGWAEGA